MLDPPRATPVEQPEDKAGRRRYGDEQRMQGERAADDRRGEPSSALRHETMTYWHQCGQRSQPADEPEHQQTKDRPFGRPVQPPAHARGVARWPVRWMPHVCSVCLKARFTSYSRPADRASHRSRYGPADEGPSARRLIIGMRSEPACHTRA